MERRTTSIAWSAECNCLPSRSRISKLLQTGDLAAFHVQASELSQRQNLTTVLYDTAGRQLLNTSVPFGNILPTDPEAISQVIETGRQISPISPRMPEPVNPSSK